jgi:hypothetical protein
MGVRRRRLVAGPAPPRHAISAGILSFKSFTVSFVPLKMGTAPFTFVTD